MNHGYADVSYEETPELIAAEKEAAIKNRLKLINLPASLKKASLAQVDLDDLGRLPVFEKLLAFVEQYPTIRKGLYLYGDFGVGKSFMVAALAHDLSENVVFHPLFSTILALSLMSKMLSVMVMSRPW